MRYLLALALAPKPRGPMPTPPYIGILLASLLIWGGIAVGIQGFSQRGIPIIGAYNVTGAAAKVIGAVCFLFGLAGIVLVFMMVNGFMMEQRLNR